MKSAIASFGTEAPRSHNMRAPKSKSCKGVHCISLYAFRCRLGSFLFGVRLQLPGCADLSRFVRSQPSRPRLARLDKVHGVRCRGQSGDGSRIQGVTVGSAECSS